MSNYLFDSTIASEVAGILLGCEAVKLSPDAPFQWSSGWKSPIYCDNRVALSFPKERTKIKELLVKLIQEKFADVEAIAGVATAGIPQGALVADMLGLPFLYVRSKPKSHGMTNQIEGRLVKGQKVVMLEDLISTGGSSLSAVKALKAAGAEVLGLAAIFNYGFEVADDNFADEQVPFYTLGDYASLITLALSEGKIDLSKKDSLDSWRQDPAHWKG